VSLTPEPRPVKAGEASRRRSATLSVLARLSVQTPGLTKRSWLEPAVECGGSSRRFGIARRQPRAGVGSAPVSWHGLGGAGIPRR